ncbi:MAG: SDR family oxidoreductase [Chloroflexi bacterium]|nr:SDR family oxidoreductase [Chloroflexota bacterium]
MAGQFEGKVVLVTGAGSGIGRASALAFAREGAKVVVVDVDSRGGEETVRLIKESGGDAFFIKTDVSKSAEVQAMVDKTVATFGRLDCAHNNAGVETALKLTADLSEEEWDRLMNINLKGVWLCLKYEIPQMLKQGKGAIVNTASVAGLRGRERRADYVTSKHGVVGLTKVAALDYARNGLRINAVCPGLTRTALVERIFEHSPAVEEESKTRLPIGRLGTPEEIAQAVVWLCSDAASFVTGHAMVVDGGILAK